MTSESSKARIADLAMGALVIVVALALFWDLGVFVFLNFRCWGGDAYWTAVCDQGAVRCQAAPAHCQAFFARMDGFGPGFPTVDNLDFLGASVFGYAECLLQIIGCVIAYPLLFLWFVIKQPLLFNPPVWLLLSLAPQIVIAILKEEFGRTTNAKLSLVENQKAFGDAAAATPSAAHLALLGKGDNVVREFED